MRPPPPTVVDVRATTPEDADWSPVVAHLRDEGVLCYPTETVYGFGCLLRDGALARLARLKRRSSEKPFIVLVRNVDEIVGLGWSDGARTLASIFWPGAVTLVLPDPDGLFPPGVRSRRDAVAVRVSPSPWVGALLTALGEPLTSTSANAPGTAPARSGSEAVASLGDLPGSSRLLVLDAGVLPKSGSSTIVDCTGPEPVVIREGTTPVTRLRGAVPELRGPEIDGPRSS